MSRSRRRRPQPSAPPPSAPRTAPGAAGAAGAPWRLRLLSIAAGLLALAALDLALRAVGLVPPPDPAMLYRQSFARGFSPLVEDGPEHWTVRPDWVNRDATLAFAPGQAPGRLFLKPGFRPARIARRKPPGVRRLVALGASSTFGLYLQAEHAFPAVTARLLEPALRVEPINLGCPGWASDRIANLMPTVLSLEPDLVVFYEGHNELLARLDPPRRGPAETLSALLLRSSSLFAWAWQAGLSWHGRGALDQDAAALAAGQVPVFDPLRLAPDTVAQPTEAEFAAAATRFRENLGSIAGACRRAGVPLVFVLPAVNLMFPPAVSAHPAFFRQRPEFDRAQRRAQQAFEAGDAEAALLALDEALRLSPRFAMAHYWRGLVLSAAGRHAEARAALQRAADCDARTHRLTSPITAALIEAAERQQVPWVDLRPDFEAQLDLASARRLFVDFCHPTREGHQRIASRLAPVARKVLEGR